MYCLKETCFIQYPSGDVGTAFSVVVERPWHVVSRFYLSILLFLGGRDIALFVYDGGLSPGLFALSLAQKLPSQFVDLGELKIMISRNEQPRIEAKIDASVFGNESEISVMVRLDLESGMRIKETYESASAFGQTIEIPEQLKYARELYITYLDEDLLVIRTASGVPEVLVRQK